jgi:hypothetical protein
MLNNRQMWLLRAIAIGAILELGVGRILLPVLRRRWVSHGALPWLDALEILLIALIVAGGLALALWLARDDRDTDDGILSLKLAIYAVVVILGLIEVAYLFIPQIELLDLSRHVVAMVAIGVITSHAILYGTSLGRTIVGLAAITLLFATMFRGVAVYLPLAGQTRWLAVGSEVTGLLLPCAITVALFRRQREDRIAGIGAGVVFLASALIIWGLTPTVRTLVAQGVGFRFAIPPMLHAVSTAAYAYVILRSLISETISPETAWAFVWLAASGIHMSYPQVEFGSVMALAMLAWTPPLRLPTSLKQRVERKRVVPDDTASAVDSET